MQNGCQSLRRGKEINVLTQLGSHFYRWAIDLDLSVETSFTVGNEESFVYLFVISFFCVTKKSPSRVSYYSSRIMLDYL